MGLWTRRKFFVSSVVGGALAGAGRLFGLEEGTIYRAPAAEAASGTVAGAARPVMISSANGVNALGKGMEILKGGGDTLEAAVAAVTVVEDDPNDDSVGYGGLPNEEGVVELDASVMHGPTRRAGSVASVQKIKNVARLAKTVMERTNHTMIVGDGALRFGVAEGFKNEPADGAFAEDLAGVEGEDEFQTGGRGLTARTRKEHMAQLFDGDAEKIAYAEQRIAHPITGTINCLAVNAKGRVGGTTTTSGLSWKIAGRLGDSPIIGAGLYVDGDVGGAGSTGKGEENIKVCGGHTIVEMMRKGIRAGGCVPGGSWPGGSELQRGSEKVGDVSFVLLRGEQGWGVWVERRFGRMGMRRGRWRSLRCAMGRGVGWRRLRRILMRQGEISRESGRWPATSGR